MAKLAFLKYTFLFNPTEAWATLYEFEKDLSDFFSAYGFEAEIIKTVEGGGYDRILQLTRVTDRPLIIPQQPASIGRPKGFKRILDDARNIKVAKAPERNFKEGKFLPSKGYIKR